jgi:hypothetical protein
MNLINEALKAIRLDKNLTQYEFAKKTESLFVRRTGRGGKSLAHKPKNWRHANVCISQRETGSVRVSYYELSRICHKFYRKSASNMFPHITP